VLVVGPPGLEPGTVARNANDSDRLPDAGSAQRQAGDKSAQCGCTRHGPLKPENPALPNTGYCTRSTSTLFTINVRFEPCTGEVNACGTSSGGSSADPVRILTRVTTGGTNTNLLHTTQTLRSIATSELLNIITTAKADHDYPRTIRAARDSFPLLAEVARDRRENLLADWLPAVSGAEEDADLSEQILAAVAATPGLQQNKLKKVTDATDGRRVGLRARLRIRTAACAHHAAVPPAKGLALKSS